MNEWELKIRNKNFNKRMKLLMKNSLKYCVIESYKIYSETIKSEVDIRHLRKTFVADFPPSNFVRQPLPSY